MITNQEAITVAAKREIRQQKRTVFGPVVKLTTIHNRTVVAVPRDLAKQLGLLEHVDRFEVSVVEGALVYRPLPRGGDFQ